MFGASFLPLNDSMPSIQVAKYVREDMHSIKAPIKAGHVFQKLWECSCGSVNKFEENVYLLCLTLQPCTLNLRPRQIHYTAGVWQMKPSLVSPKASQSKTAAFFFGKWDLLLKIGIFVPASMLAPDAWSHDEIPPMPASKRLRGFCAEPEGHID